MSRCSRFVAPLVALVALPTAAGAQEAMRISDLERAVLPLPVSERAAATVMVVEDDVARVVKEGSGEFICLGDTPGDDRFQAACYHRGLEPYMARGRELRREGLTGRESIQTRWEEIEAGDLEMPAHGMLHQVFAGPDWDGSLESANRLTVIYVPYATAEELGLPSARAEGPWIMFPGSPTAHIMIPG
ncbi:MAG: hypothetical protein OEU54_13705 [Gemmatimonadota bacterium]|nr:hypothetical protein [Gemmatimonadota bacterium]